MRRPARLTAVAATALALALTGCASGEPLAGPTSGGAAERAEPRPTATGPHGTPRAAADPPPSAGSATSDDPTSDAAQPAPEQAQAGAPAAGSPPAAPPAAPQPPAPPPAGFDKVVGNGTPASCTSQALADAVRSGGTIGFSCGGAVTIEVAQTLFTCNTANCKDQGYAGATPISGMTLDGGGLVTLSGGGARGIYYAAACSDTAKLGWVNGRCDFGRNTEPKITFRNITLANGNSQGYPAGFTGKDVGVPAGGGAILQIGGTLTLQNVTLRNNVCSAGVRVFGMPTGVTVSGSRFENNRCANGGAISSLQAPLTVTGSTFVGNQATGHGNNAGLGGNGGAIYFDGTGQNVVVKSTAMTGNATGADAGGSAIFYVSNDRTGSLTIEASTLTGNTGQAFFTAPYTSLFFQGRSLTVTGGTVQ